MLKFSLKSEIVYLATEVLKFLAQIKSFLDCEGTSFLCITLGAEGDILMLCRADCRHCNSNLDQKNPLPFQDLNPRPL